jgi:hypothetical protein
MTRRLIALLLPFLFLLAAAAGCARKEPATGCRSDGQCPSGAHCASGVCQADTRPSASIAAIDPIEEYALARLDGSSSADPDGRIVEHRWTIRSIDAPCAPPEIAGVEPVAQVRFGCAGKFEVTLTVRDDLGLDGDPARAEVIVTPSTGAAIVTAGADVGTDHVCGGSPFHCRPTVGTIQLAATAAEGVTIRWVALPPTGRPLDAHRQVVFSPGAHAATPTVEISTDGAAISGDWIFRVEAVDAYGVIGADHTRVSIRNRPPTVTFGPAGPFDHAFDPTRRVFTSSGAVAWSVSDPDGDPVEEITGIWRHVGDGDRSLFDGDFDGSMVTFAVAVPYTNPEDALSLRGGAGLARSIEIYALDANRTVGMGSAPIVIGNRPPEPAGGAVDTTASHHFDAARSMYVARAKAGTFVDPDGDPIVDSTGPGLCGTLLAAGNEVSVECAVPFLGVPAVDQLVGSRTFAVPARDPWDAATLVPVRTLEIRNSAPVVIAGTPAPAAVCSRVYRKIFDSCFSDHVVNTVTFDVTLDVSDPDGDPVLVRAATSPGGTTSLGTMLLQHPATIPLHVYQPAFMWHCAKTYPTPPISTVAATDGSSTTQLGVSPTPVGC